MNLRSLSIAAALVLLAAFAMLNWTAFTAPTALSLAFTQAARKATPPGGSPAPGQAAAEHLESDWRTVLPERLAELTAAWSEPAAWDGVAEAGGVTMPVGSVDRTVAPGCHPRDDEQPGKVVREPRALPRADVVAVGLPEQEPRPDRGCQAERSQPPRRRAGCP